MFGESLNEVKLLNKLDHPNIIRIDDFFTIPTGKNEGEIVIILEYANEGSLDKILKKGIYIHSLLYMLFWRIIFVVNIVDSHLNIKM